MQRSENSRNRATPAIEVEMYDFGVDSEKKKKKKKKKKKPECSWEGVKPPIFGELVRILNLWGHVFSALTPRKLGKKLQCCYKELNL